MTLHADDAARLFDALSHFPHLANEDRARIANAAERQHPASWADAKNIGLDGGVLFRPLTLNEACRWTPLPTAGQIIAGLNYAAGIAGSTRTKANA